jgi:hypothetical protein
MFTDIFSCDEVGAVDVTQWEKKCVISPGNVDISGASM